LVADGVTTGSQNRDTVQRVQTGVVAEDDLIGRWTFESDFSDSVGDNDATVGTGQPGIGSVEGRPAAVFDGTDGLRVSRDGHGELSLTGRDTGPFTIAFWVYFDDREGGQPFENRETASHTLYRNDTGARVLAAPADDGAVRVRFFISQYPSDTDTKRYVTPKGKGVVVPTGEWHHVAVVATPAESVRIYRDGREEFVDTAMGGYNPPTSRFWSDLTIGSWYGGDPQEWANLLDGKLSDVRVYGTGLSAEEVARIAGVDAPAFDGTVTFTTDIADPVETPTYTQTIPVVGDTVVFDASDSEATESSIESYEWDVDGDGNVDATGRRVEHEFETVDVRNVTLRVTDADAGIGTTTRKVGVGLPGRPGKLRTATSVDDRSTAPLVQFPNEVVNDALDEVERALADLEETLENDGVSPDDLPDPFLDPGLDEALEAVAREVERYATAEIIKRYIEADLRADVPEVGLDTVLARSGVSRLEAAVRNGTIDRREANEAVRRLSVLESGSLQIVDRIGPAGGEGFNLARRLGRAVMSLVVQVIFMGISAVGVSSGPIAEALLDVPQLLLADMIGSQSSDGELRTQQRIERLAHRLTSDAYDAIIEFAIRDADVPLDVLDYVVDLLVVLFELAFRVESDFGVYGSTPGVYPTLGFATTSLVGDASGSGVRGSTDTAVSAIESARQELDRTLTAITENIDEKTQGVQEYNWMDVFLDGFEADLLDDAGSDESQSTRVFQTMLNLLDSGAFGFLEGYLLTRDAFVGADLLTYVLRFHEQMAIAAVDGTDVSTPDLVFDLVPLDD
jgi:hypothetical protein